MPDPVYREFFAMQIWSESSIGATVYYARRAICPLCRRPAVGEYNWQRASADIIGPAARHWNDFIGGNLAIIKERVVRELEDAGVTGFAAHPIPIDEVESKLLRTTDTPDYYLFDAIGRIDVDRQIFDEGDGDVCAVCKCWSPRKGGKVTFGPKRHYPLIETWSGDDFLRLGNVSTGTMFCSAKVVELARVKKWTGFGVRGFSPEMPKIDHTNPDWLERFEEAIDGKFPWAERYG